MKPVEGAEAEELRDAEGELIEVSSADVAKPPIRSRELNRSLAFRTYLVIPAIFLTVTLLGGLRFGSVDNAFIFLPPALICLVFAALTLILFFRSGLVRVQGWYSDELPALQKTANTAVLLTFFTATVQIFNSLLPETGLAFWVVGFCFFWSLWNNLFADLDTKRLMRSVISLFALAFVVKFLLLANLTTAGDESWLRQVFENPGKTAFTWLLDLPRYGAATGYVQFFAVAFYLLGLWLTPRSTVRTGEY